MKTFPLVRLRSVFADAMRGALALGAMVVWSCAAQPAPNPAASRAAEQQPAPAATPTPSPAPTPEATPAASPETAATSGGAGEGKATEQHEWLTDAEGHRFYLTPYPKKQPHVRLEGDKLRTVWGVIVEVEREDEENYYIRVYEANPVAKGPSLEPEPVSAEVKASYVVDVPHVDRIQLTPFEDGLPHSGQWRHSLVLADMDGDGNLDIVHGPPRKIATTPIVFLGDGHGHWRRWNATFPEFSYDYGGIAVGDLDGDHRNDIVLAVHLHGVVALVQKQPGHFELWNRGLPYRLRADEPLGFSSRAVALLDWDHDGKLDIAALNEGPQLQMDKSAPKLLSANAGVLVFLNHGDGTWKETLVGKDSARGLFGDHLVVADLDGDRRPDLLASSDMEARRDLIFYSGKGAGRQGTIPLVRPAYSRVVAAADFTGDNKPEVVVGFVSSEVSGEWRTGIDVFRRAGPEKWDRKLVWVEEGRASLWALGTGDLDGDRNNDLVAITGDGRLIILLGNGKGGFVQQDTSEGLMAQGCRGYSAVLADLDHDRRVELVAGFAGEQSGIPGMMEEPGCPNDGSLRVWKSTPRAVDTAQ